FRDYRGRLRELNLRNFQDFETVIASYTRAKALEPASSEWYLRLARLHQARSEYVVSGFDDLKESYDNLRMGLLLPELDLTDEAAPRYNPLQAIRMEMIRQFIDVGATLAKSDEATEPAEYYLSEPEGYFPELRDAVSTDNWMSLVADGTLQWGRGELRDATRNLYQADQKLTNLYGQDNPNPALKRKLFYVLRNTEYQSLAVFYGQVSDRTPKTLIDFLETTSKTVLPTELPAILEIIEVTSGDFEKFYQGRSPLTDRMDVIKADILIRLGDREQAHEVLSAITDNSLAIQKLRLKAQPTLEDYIVKLEELVGQTPGDRDLAPALFDHYLTEGKSDNPPYARAQAVAKASVGVDPDHVQFLIMKKMSQESDPNFISAERQFEIAVQAREQVNDPYQRHIELGYLYEQMAQQARLNNAIELGYLYKQVGQQIQLNNAVEESNEYWLLAKELYQKARSVNEDLDLLQRLLNVAMALSDQDLGDEIRSAIKRVEESLEYLQLALDQYQQARKSKEDIEVLHSLLDVSMALNDLNLADEIVTAIKQQDPVLGFYHEGVLLAQQEEWENALNSIDKYLEENPISTTAYLTKAEIFVRQGSKESKEKALEAVQTAVFQNFDNIRANRLLVSLLHEQYLSSLEPLTIAQIDTILNPLIRIVQQSSRDINIVRLLLNYFPPRIEYGLQEIVNSTESNEEEKFANCQELLQNYEKMLRPAQLLFEEVPTELGLMQDLLLAYSNLNGIYTNLPKIYPNLTVDSQVQEDIYNKIDAVYQIGIAANPTASSVAGAYSNYLNNTDRGSQGEELLLDRISQLNGEEKRQAQMQLSGFYYQSGDQDKKEKARDVLQEILAEDPLHVNAKVMLAQWSADEGDFAEALSLYEEIRQEDPDNETLIADHVFLFLRAGIVDKADELMQEKKDIFTNTRTKNRLLSRVELRKSKYAAAVAYADQILVDYPNDLLALKLKADALFFIGGRNSESLECVLQLSRLPGGDTIVSPQDLALRYWAMDRQMEAIQQLVVALEANPDNVGIRQLLMRWVQSTQRWGELERFYDEKLQLPKYSMQSGWYFEAAQVSQRRGDYERENE
ncbi:MAG: tetratricopeptide repeat protein, partial [Planctomycetes bacterium]|nr:tetratricopeptide repeat protein [Planctomycetota bacterium]